MKVKKTLFLFLLSCILSIGFISSQAFASDLDNPSDENLIKDTINSYFSTTLESVSNNQSGNYDDIILNSIFKEYVQLNDKYLCDINKGLNRTLTNYDFNIIYNNIEINDKAVIDLNLGNALTYNENSEIYTSTSNTNHIIVLEKYNNKWYVNKDIYDPLEAPNKEEINNEDYNQALLDFLKDSYKEIDIKIEGLTQMKVVGKLDDFKKAPQLKSNSLTASTMAATRYYPASAVDYARRYAKVYNTNFPSYENDCANFVSQCLNYGGVGRNDYFNYVGPTKSWIEVRAQHDYLVNNGFGFSTEYSIGKVGTMSYYSRPGDVINFYNKFYGRYNHTALVTERYLNNGQDDLKFCAHTTDRYDNSLRAVLAQTNLYSELRLISMY